MEFTPHCIPKRPLSGEERTQWSRVTATFLGEGRLPIAATEFPKPIYVGGQIEAGDFDSARWDLIPRNRYMWASVQTVRGCPQHCSFCLIWRTDGQRLRQRASDVVIEEIVQLRRLGFRFIALADDNFYPVTLTDLSMAVQPKKHCPLE